MRIPFIGRNKQEEMYKIKAGLNPSELELIKLVVDKAPNEDKDLKGGHYIPGFAVEGKTLDGKPYRGFPVLFEDYAFGEELVSVAEFVIYTIGSKPPEMFIRAARGILGSQRTLESYAQRNQKDIADMIHYNLSAKTEQATKELSKSTN